LAGRDDGRIEIILVVNLTAPIVGLMDNPFDRGTVD